MSSKVSIDLKDLILLRAEARGFSFLPHQPVGSLLSGRHSSRLRGRGLSFAEIRRYQIGDDIRSIDWNTTARTRKTHVRVFTEERERMVYLIVDQRRSMFFGSRRAMKSVAAAELAALAAWRALVSNDRVGGVVFDDQELHELRPHRSRARLLNLLDKVAAFNQKLTLQSHRSTATPQDKGTPASPTDKSSDNMLNKVLQSALRNAKHDCLLVLISDLTGANEETERLASRIAAHNDLIVAAVYDPLGASLAGKPGMVASAGDKSWEIPSSSHFQEQFQLAFQRRLDLWRDIFSQLKVPVIPISTHQSVADQIRSLFGATRGKS